MVMRPSYLCFAEKYIKSSKISSISIFFYKFEFLVTIIFTLSYREYNRFSIKGQFFKYFNTAKTQGEGGGGGSMGNSIT